MDKKKREQLTLRVIERMTRAILGEPREVVSERYLPVLESMSDAEFKRVCAQIVRQSDIQLYLVDEKVHALVAKSGETSRIGRQTALIFESMFPAPAASAR